MSYGQKNFLQAQGIPPTRYRIDQIGCFLVAFSNLLERFGEGVNPITLNDYFVNHGTYVDVDDGVRDDLGWGSVSAYNGNLVVSQVGGAGWPNTNEAIVKFHFKSPRTGIEQDHFCLVADHNASTIVDSYDGVVRAPGYYGQPVAWASYALNQPQPVQPPPPSHPYSVASIGAKDLVGNKAPTHLWNLDLRSWAAMRDNPVATINQGERVHVVAIASHILGGRYYMPDPNLPQGYNVVDLDEPPAPAPAPEPPKPEAPLPELTPMPIPTPPEGEAVPVTVIPDAYKKSYRDDPAELQATSSALVEDFEGKLPPQQLVEGQVVHQAGVFVKNGKTYARTINSVQNGRWYGIDCEFLGPIEGDAFDLDLALEAKELLGNLSGRENLVARVARLEGLLIKLLNFVRIKKNKGVTNNAGSIK